jgi:hypothetical protein
MLQQNLIGIFINIKVLPLSNRILINGWVTVRVVTKFVYRNLAKYEI